MTRSSLKDFNPIVLIIILIVVSILASFDRLPYMSFSLVSLIIIIQWIWTDMSLLNLLKQLRFALLLAFINVFFIWLTRTLSGLEIDYLYLSTLVGRFLVFAGYAFAMINNVSPKLLTMSLIKYFRMSDRIGYTFMAVYNFIPNYQKELKQIKYTYSIRGLNETGLFSGLRNIFQYSIPLLVTSIRKGIRLAVSMENRGLGKFNSRSYYQELVFNKRDGLFLAMYLLFIALFSILGVNYNFVSF